MKIKNTLLRKIGMPLAVVAGLSGCEDTPRYIVNRADIPGTSEHNMCWVEGDEDRQFSNRLILYVHSPARDEGYGGANNGDIYARVTEERMRELGYNPENHIPLGETQ